MLDSPWIHGGLVMPTLLNEKPETNEQSNFDRLWNKYGRGILSFSEGASELGYATPKAAYSALDRGKFPVKVSSVGGRKAILVINLARFLDTGMPQSQIEDAPPRRGPGRPPKGVSLASGPRA